MKKGSNWVCSKCGDVATEGSMAHPLCKKCFKEVWNNDNSKYYRFLNTHI